MPASGVALWAGGFGVATARAWGRGGHRRPESTAASCGLCVCSGPAKVRFVLVQAVGMLSAYTYARFEM